MNVDKLADAYRKRPGVIDYLKGTKGNPSKREQEKEDEAERRPCKVLEDSAVQTYLKIGDTFKEKQRNEGIRIQSLLDNNNIVSPRDHAHFLITPSSAPIKSLHFKSLHTIRNVTQQSMAPSQKTLIKPAPIHTLHSPVSQSHVHTLPSHSHIPQGKPSNHPQIMQMDSPSSIFHSYIPSKITPCISERQMEYPSPFWREKYEQLQGRWQALRLRQVKEREMDMGRVAVLQEKYEALRENHSKLSEQYRVRLEENQQYYQRMQELQAKVNRLQLSSGKNDNYDSLLQQLKQKQEHIESLSARLAHLQGDRSFKTAFQQKCLLVGLLKRQNESFQSHLKHFQEQYNQEMQEMHEQVGLLRAQIDHPEGITHPLKGSFLKSQPTPLDRSLDYTNTRITDLEAHITKLNAEQSSRETHFGRQLKQANNTIADLAERLRISTVEREETVMQLQQKVGTAESELNKKQSIIRNLRDELAILKQSPPMYSSTISPHQDSIQDPIRRDHQNLRRILFQRERQKLSLRQKLQQSQQALLQMESGLQKKRLQNQQLRRQATQVQSLQHQNTKLMEVLAKKNADMSQMKEMLMEKEQQAGDFQNLTKENDRLRSFMLKKNEELSQMADRLFQQEKKAREREAAHAAEIAQLEQQSHHLQEVIARREHELTKLAQQFDQIQGNYAELQLQLQRQRQITAEYESVLKANALELQQYQQQLANKHQIEGQNSLLRERVQECETSLMQKEQLQGRLMKQVRELSSDLAMRQEEIQQMALQQTHLKEMHYKSAKELCDAQNKQDELQGKYMESLQKLKKCKERLCNSQKELSLARKQLKKHQKCPQIIDEYQQRIASLEVIVIKLNMRPTLKHQISEPLFENRVIYHLKGQNEALQEEIRSINKDNSIIKHAQNSEGVKHRLDLFRDNLQQVIRK